MTVHWRALRRERRGTGLTANQALLAIARRRQRRMPVFGGTTGRDWSIARAIGEQEIDEPEWCDGCDLPLEACCCPEGDGEYDEGDQ